MSAFSRVILALTLCSALGVGQPPAKVIVAPVTAARHIPAVEILGAARAYRTGRCSSQTSGLVLRIAVVEGLDVAEKDETVFLDTTALALKRREAAAELELSAQQLKEYEAGSRPEEVREKQEALAEASALLERTEDEQERIAKLMTTGAATTEDQTRARLAVAAAKAVLARRQAELDLVLAGPRKELIARSRAQVEIQAARLATIDDEIEKGVIPAPFAGRVTEKRVGVGDYVMPGTVLFELVQLDPIKVEIPVPERLVGRLAPGTKLTATFDALPGQTFESTVEGIVPIGAQAGRTFPVRLLIANPTFTVLPGMLSRVSVPAGEAIAALSVPGDALIHGPNGAFVYVVRDGKAVVVPVTLLAVQSAQVPVTGDLREGESVVVRGNERLRPDQAVVVLPGDGR